MNSLAVVVQASNETLAAFGKAAKPAPEIIAGMVHPTAPRLGLLADVTDPAIQDELARLYDRLAWQSSGLATLYPGVETMLADIAGLGMAQAVLSNSAGRFIRTILQRLGVASRFFRLVGDDDMPAPKPDPRGLVHLLDEAACPRSGAVYVGDSRTDLHTARAAQIRAIGVSWGAHPRHELEALGFDVIVDSPPALVDALKSFW